MLGDRIDGHQVSTEYEVHNLEQFQVLQDLHRDANSPCQSQEFFDLQTSASLRRDIGSSTTLTTSSQAGQGGYVNFLSLVRCEKVQRSLAAGTVGNWQTGDPGTANFEGMDLLGSPIDVTLAMPPDRADVQAGAPVDLMAESYALGVTTS
jgi:hypothetical protein